MRMRRYRVGVWIEQGRRNERTAPIREGIVPCRPARELDASESGVPAMNGNKSLVVAGLINGARRLCPSSHHNPPPPIPPQFSFDTFHKPDEQPVVVVIVVVVLTLCRRKKSSPWSQDRLQ